MNQQFIKSVFTLSLQAVTDPKTTDPDVDIGMATDDDIEASKGVMGHWMEIIKVVFIGLKVAFICTLMTLAIIARRKKHGRYDLVAGMLCVNISVLVGMFFFEIGTKYIAAFFVMIFAANYINFLGFNILTRNLRTPEGKYVKQKTNPYFITMNVLYVIVAGLCFVEYFGPWCTGKKMYPPVLSFAELLLIINAVYHNYLHYNNYFLQWEENPECKAIVGRESEFEG